MMYDMFIFRWNLTKLSQWYLWNELQSGCYKINQIRWYALETDSYAYVNTNVNLSISSLFASDAQEFYSVFYVDVKLCKRLHIFAIDAFYRITVYE